MAVTALPTASGRIATEGDEVVIRLSGKRPGVGKGREWTREWRASLAEATVRLADWHLTLYRNGVALQSVSIESSEQGRLFVEEVERRRRAIEDPTLANCRACGAAEPDGGPSLRVLRKRGHDVRR